ncbi:MAG: Coenzyme F420 hydrogenase/dehydrogenase, beta subunit C-terminal domain [bacterium]
MRITNIKDVVDWRLCVGCGLCASICDKNKIQLVDVIDEGIRPVVQDGGCGANCDCLQVCPGYQFAHEPAGTNSHANDSLQQGWGPVLELWEGYASDAEIRYSGSSAGLATAIALYCLEKEGMHGVLHIEGDPEQPWRNRTALSRNRAALSKRTGSRYAPASPCDSIDRIESAPGPCVFIGKPCDVAGLRNAQARKPEIDKNLGLTIGIFCAGTPSTRGTLDLLDQLEVEQNEIEEIRYRGKGWPGNFMAKLNGASKPIRQLSYKESWGFLQKYRPYRCYLCPDGTSEFADISCGDPWYREIEQNERGHSLVVVRTERGRKILQGAMRAGYVHLARAGHEKLEQAQKNLLAKRSAIWGRLLAIKAFGIPTPRFAGFSLFQLWRRIPIMDKLRSTLGTVRRIVKRRYFQRLNIFG